MKKVLLTFLLLFLMIGHAKSVTINVPSEQATIQAGINAAVDGDTVLVADGIYTGTGNHTIDLKGKAILLTSENGPHKTIIRCSTDSLDRNRGFFITKGETNSTRINGFTIRDASYSSGGAAFICGNASPFISNCLISNNTASVGAALYCWDGAPILENCTIVKNSAGTGSAVFYSRSSPVLRNCLIGVYQTIQTYDTSNITLECCYTDGNPGFCDTESEDYHLLESSPCTSENSGCGVIGAFDIGCIDGTSPFAEFIELSPLDSNNHVSTSHPLIHWIYNDTIESNQEGFQLEISKKPFWMGDILWQSGFINSSVNEFEFNGDSLYSHSVYYLRIKLKYNNEWGPWREKEFFSRYSTIIKFPGSQILIQDAINVAFDFDTILIADGHYFENSLLISNKKVSIKSENGPENTIIDADGLGGVFILADIPESTLIIEGLTITGGHTFDGHGGFNGGGFRLKNASPIIKNCIIKNNEAVTGHPVGNAGGGLYIETSSPYIEDCTITLNKANAGGGIYSDRSKPIISNCIIAFNGVGGILGHGGIDDLPLLECSDIYGNLSGSWGEDYIVDQLDIRGNFSLDPLFCDAVQNDFNLKSNSPCFPVNNSCGKLIGALDVHCIQTDIEDLENILPQEFALNQNYPNPFNPTTTIDFNLPIKSNVSINLYNLLGQQIKQLVNHKFSAGIYSVTWDGTTAEGVQTSSGIYFYRIETDSFTETKKMLLLK